MKDSHEQTMNEIDSVAAQLVPQQFVQSTETASTLPAEVTRQEISIEESFGKNLPDNKLQDAMLEAYEARARKLN